MNKKLLSTSGIVMAVVMLLAINILAGVGLKSLRFDLTDNRLYTLSEGTRNVINSLEEPVTLRFYYSEKLATGIPGFNSYAQRVRELLEEYAGISDGKIKLIVTDPEPFSEEEDQAVQHGLQGIPSDSSGSQIYFGLVGSSATDEQSIIPFFQAEKETSLEYDLTRLIYKLGKPKKPVLGILTTLPMQGSAQNPFAPPQGNQEWTVISQLRQLFDVRFLDNDISEIAADVDVLMLVHPKEFSDSTLFAIDQYALKGGHILAFIDPYAEMDQPEFDQNNPMASMQASRGSDLGQLLGAWGIEMESGKLVGEKGRAMRVNVRNGSRTQPVDYVLWMQIDNTQMSKDDFVTSELQQINLGTAGYLRSKAGAGTEMTPLIETGSQAATFDSSVIQFGANPIALLNQYKAGGDKLTLAARVSGSIKTAFPEGNPNGGKDADLKESQEPINMIIVADSDILTDNFWVNVQRFFNQRIAIPFSGNGTFVINAVENLSGSNDLISLRSRDNSIRPFYKVKEIQREAEQQFRDKEKELQARLQETQRKINELQQQKSGNSTMILSQEQQREIERFRNEQVKTRKELRNVQHELRKNIERLGDTLKFINITLIPLLIIVLAIVIGVKRQRRMNRLATQ